MKSLKYSLIEYILFFFFYSAVGWIVECLYCLYIDKKWTNRGFLFGPICPIYGCGALAMLLTLTWCKQWPWVMIPLGMVVCDTVEYISSFVMEKMFHARWWDYSNHKFNLNGRICLRHTIFWGIAATVFMYLVDPFVGQPLMLSLRNLENGPKIQLYILIAILVVFAADFIRAVKNALDIRQIMDKLRQFADNVKKFSSSLTKNQDDKTKQDFSEKLNNFYSRFSDKLSREKNGKKRSNRIFTNYRGINEQSQKTLNELEDIIEDTNEQYNDNNDQ